MKLARKSRKVRKASRHVAGFTLLEFVVAVAIFTIVTSAIYLMLDVGRSDNFTANARTEMLQNARVALETIRRDANNAGDRFWKSGALVPDTKLNTLMFLNIPANATPDTLAPVVPGNNVVNITVDGSPVATDVLGFVYAENAFNLGPGPAFAPQGDVAVTAINKGNNVCTINQSNATSIFAANKVYVIDNGTTPVIGVCTGTPANNQIRFAAGDQLGINVEGNSGTFQSYDALTLPAALRELNWVEYYVNAATNTLVRRSFGSRNDQVGNGTNTSGVYPGYVDMPLAFNVDNFQVQYVLDSGDTLDDITLITDWQRIRMIRAAITIRSPEADPKTQQPIRSTVTAIYFVRNLANQERPS